MYALVQSRSCSSRSRPPSTSSRQHAPVGTVMNTQSSDRPNHTQLNTATHLLCILEASTALPVHAIKACGGLDVQTHTLLSVALEGGERFTSHSGRFTPEERASSIDRIRGWVSPRTAPDFVDKRKKISCHRRESSSDPSIGKPMARPLYSLCSHRLRRHCTTLDEITYKYPNVVMR